MATVAKDQEKVTQAWTYDSPSLPQKGDNILLMINRATRAARAATVKKLAELGECLPDAVDGVFEAVEKSLAEFRLGCVTTIFLDIEFAHQKDVEDSLWTTQTRINQSYRTALKHLRKTKANVVRNKVERRYLGYLKTSQQFYKAYIQRLASRYIIPEIEEICLSLGLEPLPEKERVDPVAINVDGNISKSCYNTLIHMGDLSRYRYQQSHKGIESGTTYYTLAQKLKPENGMAHHQMGVLYNEQGRHLEITYHFYRAAVCKEPHIHAIKNLQVEFNRALDNDFLQRRGGNNSSFEVLKSWFVRLHANFHRGQKFAEYEELENEVVHRLKLALKSNDASNAILQMLLVNFAAYHKAQKSLSDEWTVTSSQFCQFALRLIVRTTLSLSEAIHAEIINLVDDRKRLSPDGSNRSGETFNPVLIKLLPLFRLTCVWLAYHHVDIAKHQEHLEPYIEDMYRLVAKAQTSFANAFDERCPDPANLAPYLLAEDQETLGFLPMENDKVFYGLRFHFDRGGKRKPFARKGAQEPATQENWWRVRDILNCGLFLVADPKIPLQLASVKGVGEMIYTDDTPVLEAEPSPVAEKTGAFDEALDLMRQRPQSQSQEQLGIDVPTMQSPHNAATIPSNDVSPYAAQRSAQSPAAPMGLHPSARIPSQHSTVPMESPQVMHTPSPMPTRAPTLATEETDESLENQMVNMVDDLVAGGATDQPQPSQDSSSYDLGDTTRELLSKLKSPDKAFPQLPQMPWNFYLNNPSNPTFSAQSSQFAQGQPRNPDVYQQIYGGAAAFGSSRKAQGLSSPGWTSTQVKTMGSPSQWGSSQAHAQSTSAQGVPKLQSPSNAWDPNKDSQSQIKGQAQKMPTQPQTATREDKALSKSPETGGLGVPGYDSKAGAHIRKSSQGEYETLYQRLVGMTSAEPPAQKSPTNLSFGSSHAPVTSLGQAAQQQRRQSGLSPSYDPQLAGLRPTPLAQQSHQQTTGMSPVGNYQQESKGMGFPPSNGSASLKPNNQWPQYGPQSYNMSSLNKASVRTATTTSGPAPTTGAGASYYSGTTATAAVLGELGSAFPASGSSSIWGSTLETGGRGYDTETATAATSACGRMGVTAAHAGASSWGGARASFQEGYTAYGHGHHYSTRGAPGMERRQQQMGEK
ncbi:hypothetical protein MKZ38_003407 [Zalerion maritima]|uniref:Nonsense-mediated mRNA decay factor n=1 Tax=Zalerion maritima TaxID=339359 RepID=A0AAD5WQ93_9PEZI|nr:hypothetical protein MKZ38_003407 [Zalerion maritima]